MKYVQKWMIRASEHERGQDNISKLISGDIYDMITASARLKGIGYKKVKITHVKQTKGDSDVH